MVNDLHKLETDKFADDGSVTVVSKEHMSVEESKVNRFSHSFGMGANSTVYFQIDIGEHDLHFKERLITVSGINSIVNYTVIEDPSFTTGTNVLPIRNPLRSDGDTNIYATIYDNPTNISGGIITDEVLIPESSKQNGVSAQDDILWVYKANSTLIVELENTGSAIDVNIKYKWYIEN